MSVCLEHNTVLANPVVGTSSPDTVPNTTITPTSCEAQQQKNVTKLIVTNNASTVVNNTTTVIPTKLVNQPLITVLNSPGPLTVVKSLCVTTGVTSAPQFTLVNSTPLTVTNATGKSTITLLNAPVALVKAVPAVTTEPREIVASTGNVVTSNNGTDKPAAIHNVFVKNTCAPDLVQEAKFSTQTIISTSSVSPPIKTVNGQKPTSGSSGKVKILSNVVMSPAGAGPSNIVLNKTSMQRYVPRQKVISNGATVTAPPPQPPTTAKYINKPPLNNAVKQALPSLKMEKMPHQRPLYPTHKGQIKTLPPVNNYMQKSVPGIKTLPPQKGIPSHVQRTNAGIRTIPPQRPSKPPNKTNYIGKHAVQAQKIKSSHHSNKLKSFKPPPPSSVSSYNNRMPQNSAMNFNQALTAEIIQTLSHESGPSNSYGLSKSYDLPPASQYESPPSSFMENREVPSPVIEDKPYHPSSGLNTLSLICHAVYLDHNYNATMPPDSPTRNSPPANTSPQINGLPGSSLYSPGSATKRLRPSPNNSSSNIMPPIVPTLSTASLLPPMTPSHNLPEEDAASDVSCLSDRKPDTEGEETDTAPEAEAVNNDDQFDHYGDYVTRCICGFLHDDGYMIECDRCKVWQHVRCVVRNKQVPDEYLCEVCDPTKSVDRQKARLLQQQWMRETQLAMEAKLRKEVKLNSQLKHKDALTESDSSDGEQVGKSRVNTSRRKDNHKHGNSRLRRDSARDSIQKRPNKRKDRKLIKRKPKPQAKSQSDEDIHHDPWINSQLPQLRQWIDNYEEAVTNHYSPELRARISNIRINGTHSDLSTEMEPGVQKCRIHSQPLTGLKYLVSTVFLPPNTPVVELRGKYMLSTQHRNSGSGGSLTTRQHAQRPGPFLFFYRLHSRDNTEVCVDTRTYGNSARFVRRSCRPNAELRHCIEKGVLHLYIVTIADIERNVELTIKHESHDLAAVGTTHIACACGSPDECLMNKTTGSVTMKKNGEKTDTNTTNYRKRRSRRTNSSSGDQEVPQRIKETTPPPPPPPPLPSPPELPIENPPDDTKQEVEEMKPEPKVEDDEEEEQIKTETIIEKEEVKEEVKKEEDVTASGEDEEEKVEKKENDEQSEAEEEREAKSPTPPPPPPPPVTTRRSSHKSSEPEDKKETSSTPPPPKDDKKNKKLSREERKIEAYMKAFERMEKLQQRRQEHQAKQAHRRESEPGPGKDDEKSETKTKRRKRKGRARTTSTNSQASRRNRLNSADSSYATSGDEQMLSPNDNNSSRENLATSKENSRDAEPGSPDKAVGLLLSLANGSSTRMEANNKTPPHDMDSNSNSANSSPETPLSSACLLVAAAVGPLEPGFKFPKTKKGLMNEWLNKTDIQSASAISPSSLTPHIHSGSEFDTTTGFYAPVKNLSGISSQSGPSVFCESPGANVEPRSSAKKRWLRQAISEDQCDSPNSRPDSPPISEAVAAPPKKRRLPRESLSNNPSPPTTPTNITAPPLPENVNKSSGSDEGRVEIVYSGTEGDSPTQVLESDAVLKERAAEMQQEFAASLRLPEPPKVDHLIGTRFLLDPRLRRDAGLFTNSEHLVGTVEKTLSFLGYEDKKPENITPAKRKLSITEYRQRKKLNNNDKVLQEETIVEENNLSQSPKQIRRRSNSSSSITSFASSDEETKLTDIAVKAPAFNSEPTAVELQRENVGLRLKKAFGLSVDEDSRKPALNMETLLNCEIPPVVKTTPRLLSPTFPIPGTVEPPSKESGIPIPHEEQPHLPLQPPESMTGVVKENVEEISKNPVLYYTPDDEELVHQQHAKEVNAVDHANCVPLFNDPVYPSTSYSSLTDDDTRYEGRNPSPPPELDVSVADAAGSYQMT